MNRHENEASNKNTDSLINFETVKYFNAEAHEGRRYEALLARYNAAALKTQTSLSLLNFGQGAIFSVALTGMMMLAAQVCSHAFYTCLGLSFIFVLMFYNLFHICFHFHFHFFKNLFLFFFFFFFKNWQHLQTTNNNLGH